MAIYHLSAKSPVRRGDGRCSTAAAAYRAGCVIIDDRTGTTHDYRRRQGVVSAQLRLPGGTEITDRAAFWNAVECHHKRRDAVVAREVVVALPHELPDIARQLLARELAIVIAERYQVAVDFAVHAPSGRGDDRNDHAHLLMTACQVDPTGALGAKAVLLDPIHCRRAKMEDSVSWLRPTWEALVNAALAKAGSQTRINHRSHATRGIARRPTVHEGIGPSAAQRRYRNAIHRQRNVECDEIDRTITRLNSLKSRLLRKAQSLAKQEYRTRIRTTVANSQQPGKGLSNSSAPLAKLLSRLKTSNF